MIIIKGKIRKVISVLLSLCMIWMLLPVNNMVYAADQQVYWDLSASTATGKPGDVIDVTLSVRGEPAVGVVMPSDVVMVMDVSGSMSSDSRISRMQEAAKDFVNMLDYSVHQVGVVAYETDTAAYPLSTSPADINAYIDTLSAGGTTSTDLGIAEGVNVLNAGRSNATKVLIVLTDGQANSTALMLQAAEAAKTQNIVIFTVALLSAGEDPSTSQANLNMEMVATSDGHHHIVLGSTGLKQAYDEISQQIGVANVYNVRITQAISPQFEYVEGSADHNIPKPVFNGNSLTWKMEELREETVTLTYQLRIKNGTASGTYPHTQSGNIRYKTYTGQSENITLTTLPIMVTNDPVIITSISQTDFDAAGGESVVITGQNFDDDAELTVDGHKQSKAVFSNHDTVSFVMPDHVQGNAEVRITNPSKETAAVTVRFMATPVITKISPNIGEYEGGRAVKISGNYFMEGVVVTFDGMPAEVTKTALDFIKVKTPFLGKSGIVDVVVTNPDGTTISAPAGYTYGEAPTVPEPAVTKIDKTAGNVGVAEQIKLTIENFTDARSFQVTVGGVPADIRRTDNSSFIKCYVPTTLPEGCYDIVVTSTDGNGANQTATLTQAYTYNAKPAIPAPTITSINKTQGSVGNLTAIKISGSNFTFGGQACVTIGGETAMFVSGDTTWIKIKTPRNLPAGTYDLVVTNADGQQAVMTDAFTFQ